MSVLDFTVSILGLASRFQFSVTSWGRSVKHNLAVGGVVNSLHLVWLGMDIVLDDASAKASFILAAERQGLVVVDEQDHLHVQVPRVI